MKLSGVELLHVLLPQGQETLRVGRLASRGHRIFFEYDPSFLGRGLQLSPRHLPVRPGVHEEKTHIFDGLFGLFHDSLPDGWGRLLLDRALDRSGIDRSVIRPLDRLALVGQRGMGALVYEPEMALAPTHEGRVDLDAIARSATRVLEGAADDVFPALLSLGGSSGGARPKVLVGWRADDGHLTHGSEAIPADHEPYIVKFRAPHDDPEDVGRIEYAYARMAEAAGLVVAPTRLFAGKRGAAYFGTRRFDRTAEGRRVHVHSLGGLLHASHRVAGSVDYEMFIRTTRALTRDQREVERAFRQMVFNVLAHNRDDHVKNFAFLMDEEGTWRLSPAFDLTLSDGPGGEHWMAVAGEGRAPTEAHMRHVAAAGALDEAFVGRCLAEVRDAVSRWAEFANEAELGAASRLRIAERLGVGKARTQKAPSSKRGRTKTVRRGRSSKKRS